MIQYIVNTLTTVIQKFGKSKRKFPASFLDFFLLLFSYSGPTSFLDVIRPKHNRVDKSNGQSSHLPVHICKILMLPPTADFWDYQKADTFKTLLVMKLKKSWISSQLKRIFCLSFSTYFMVFSKSFNFGLLYTTSASWGCCGIKMR